MRIRTTVIALVLLAGPIGFVRAQEPAGAQKEPTVVVTQPDESKFPEITVYFELKNPDGSFIRDAARDEFRVTEDGKDRPILGFEAPISKEVRPTTVVLVVDRSGSMNEDNRMRSLKRAVASFVEQLPEGSKVAVIAFSSRVDLICPFTTDRERILRSVNRLEAVGSTRYFDAVAEALEILSAQQGRRAVLALTDGEDTFSQSADLESVIALARRMSLPVHALALGDEGELASEKLRLLAEQTRGNYYRATNADELRKIYEEIAERLGSSYSLTYNTDRKLQDGTLRPIQVFYKKSQSAGETAVFIRGMVVPASGWSWLYLGLFAGLGLLAALPGILRNNRSTTAGIQA